MYWSRFFVTIFFFLFPPKVLSFSFYSPNRWHRKHASIIFCDVVGCLRTMHSRPFRIGTGGRKIPESSEKYEWVRFKMIVCSTLRYYSLIGLIVSTARTMYPGWRIRIYHNVTRENKEVLHSSHFTTEASLKAGVGKILRLLLHRGHSWSLWCELFTCYGPMELSKTTWDVLEDASKN